MHGVAMFQAAAVTSCQLSMAAARNCRSVKGNSVRRAPKQHAGCAYDPALHSSASFIWLPAYETVVGGKDMKNLAFVAVAPLLIILFPHAAMAGPKNKHWGPPGLAKKGGLPPGIAKKYARGQRLPYGTYVPIETRYNARIPYQSPEGRKWVRIGRDLYLLSAATGTIVDVTYGWLR